MIDMSFVDTLYDFTCIFDELLDEALNKLSPKEYDILLNRINCMIINHGYGG